MAPYKSPATGYAVLIIRIIFKRFIIRLYIPFIIRKDFTVDKFCFLSRIAWKAGTV